MVPVRTVLVSTILAAGVLTAAGCGAGDAPGSPPTQVESTTEAAASVDNVVLDADAGTIRLRRGPDGASSVERTLRWDSGTKPQVTQSVEGRTLKVTARCPADSRGCETDLTVTVPAASSSTVRLATGDIGVDGLRGAQDLRNTTGPVGAVGVGPGPVTTHTDTGPVDIALSVAAPTVTAETGTGPAQVKVPRDATYQVRTSVVTGDQQVEVPNTPGAPHVVEAHTQTGSVTVAFG